MIRPGREAATPHATHSTYTLSTGHNIQGAKQPLYMHIGGRRTTRYKGVVRRPNVGEGVVVGRQAYYWRLKIWKFVSRNFLKCYKAKNYKH